MIGRSRIRAGGPAAVLVALLAMAVFAPSASASESPPENVELPTISPATLYQGQEASASTGSWHGTYAAHWFACTEQTGGRFASAECGKEGYPSKWEMTQLGEGKSTSLTSPGGTIAISGTVSGVKFTPSCETSFSSSSVENPAGGAAGSGQGTLSFVNCKEELHHCTVTPGSAVAEKIELPNVEGKTEAVIAPKEGTVIGSFTFSGCEITGMNKEWKLYGSVVGAVSNPGSALAFDSASSGGGALRFVSTSGPIATATGSIALQTAAGGHIRADANTYAYQWNLCGFSCYPISGATGARFTPTEGNVAVGATLSVTVTATNPAGSTTVESKRSSSVKQRLSWYACGKWEGPGVYEDASCTAKGGSNPYEWSRRTSGSFDTSNHLELGGEGAETYLLRYTLGEVSYELTCVKGEGHGSIANSETRAQVEGYKTTLSGCTSDHECQITGGKITSTTLTGKSPEAPSSLKHEITFEPSEGTTLATFEMTGCEYSFWNGTYSLTGKWPTQVENGKSRMITLGEESLNAGMKVQVRQTAVKARFEALNTMSTEGGLPLKLDTGA